tara:strand:- start:12525 stop:13913 length:1389 start_codon:yes stop_codon:yes gene_type:complete
MKYDKLAIVGLGNVGELVAISSIMGNGFNEVYVYNRDSRPVNGRSRSDAKLRNLTDAAVMYNTQVIRCDSYDDLPSDALTVITIKEGYDYRFVPANRIRQVTSRKDAPLMRKVAEAYARKDFTGQVLMVSNPIGPMSHLFQHYSGIDDSQIHPVGAMLDSARYTKFIKQRLGVPEADVDALAVGEHGPSVVFLRSSATVDGRPLNSYGIDLAKVERDTMREGPIEATTIGYTNAGITACLQRMFGILQSEDVKPRFPFGMRYEDVFVELPVVKLDGVYTIQWPDFDRLEKQAFDRSVRGIRRDSEEILGYATERQIRRVLVVDDELAEAETLVMTLEEAVLDDLGLSDQNEFYFEVVGSGQSFVDAVKDDPIGYDLAIVDQRMPGMTGLEAIVESRKYQPELDCVILSGKSEMADLQEMVNQDGIYFVQKPFFDPNPQLDMITQESYRLLRTILERTQQKIA